MEAKIKATLDKFFSDYRLQKYKKGETLIKPNEDPQAIFYLTSGIVRQYSISQAGDELNLNLYKPNSFFPMSWAINGSLNLYYYEALTAVEVRKAPKNQVLKFIKDEPDVQFNLLKRIFSGLDGLFERLEYFMIGNSSARLLTEILNLSKRFGVEKNGLVTIELKLTEKDLAAETGIARETVSRVIHQLENKKLIDFKKSILTIKDLKALKKELANNKYSI